MAEEKKCRWKDRDNIEHPCHLDQSEWPANYDENEHCIFHAREKDAGEFRRALARLIAQWRNKKIDTWDFAGFVFTDYVERQNLFQHLVVRRNVVFRDTIFLESISFRRSIVRGRSYFDRATFCKNVSFWTTAFGGTVYFRGAVFQGTAIFGGTLFKDASFKDSVFNGNAEFGGAVFSGSSSFKHVRFVGWTVFANGQFNGNANFNKSVFNERVSFRSSAFLGLARFQDAEFLGDTSLGSARFHMGVDMRGTIFHAAADFRKTTFGADAQFASSMFRGNMSFRNATFVKSASFRSATCRGAAYFEQATFGDEADFWSVCFNKHASFGDADFKRDARFAAVRFRRGANFREVAFRGKSSFRGVTMRKTHEHIRKYWGGYDVNLTNCSFARLADFAGCRIVGHVRWAWPGPGEKRDTGESGHQIAVISRGTLLLKKLRFRSLCLLDLRRNELADDVHLKIHDCKMGHILLEGTDCTKIGFYNNEWPPAYDEFFKVSRRFRGIKMKRDAVGDECHAANSDERDWKLIRRTYQQLARRFREDLDHPRANEFDRGSFEMRRQESKSENGALARSTYIGLSIYKYLSHYSGNLALPLIWLSVGTLCFGWWYSLVLPDRFVTWNPAKADWSTIEQVYINTLQVLNLGRAEGESLLHGSIWIELLKLFQRAFSATMITLFIFAIRRRFKH